MIRNPRVDDFKRKIKIVFFNKTDSDLEKFHPFFNEEYFEIKGEKKFNEINTNIISELPDIIVCTDNFTIAVKGVEKLIYYIKYNDFFNCQKELSIEIKKQAYKNYIEKIKYQVYLIIGKKENPNKNEIIKKLLNLLDLKDKYTRDHSIRVATYSLLIGEKLKLAKEKLETLRNIALLHDIGKLGIPFSIVNKPADLTSKEMKVYQYHPIIARHILDFPLFDGMRKSILYHHERMDGRGYFKKKSSKEIPLYARIISVADTFDIMTTSNLYGKRMTQNQAIEYFSKYTKESKKMPFDYHIVRIFLKILKERENIFPDMNLLVDDILQK